MPIIDWMIGNVTYRVGSFRNVRKTNHRNGDQDISVDQSGVRKRRVIG